MTIDQIARVAYDCQRALVDEVSGEKRQSWTACPQWFRDRTIARAQFHIGLLADNATAVSQWIAQREAEGWTWGPTLDGNLKTDPMLIPWENMTKGDQVRYKLFLAVVRVLASELTV